ncbi:ATP:dephospho-CoA triphosphoribosyl transferase [Rubripirellula lacrimiformis]|uniref:ATP:dephospho-CoA triphosphoribosyl transferase n=1 Tax=Rubripirellula lacrimiformis TaxID=1930273 RepID=A0A517N935_9BACT|nr:triphosphoribosyl-dephospho-CoA synthase [Rubripirellula lacrimiformis]QDT03653.1 ATP:dephospho-CoA triphosphoribosyl transferase [Rubripirellula lacrimiformis]
MPDTLNLLRSHVGNPADAIRWACLLEATAPKAGNVYPGKSFHDLTYQDFQVAAETCAIELSPPSIPITQRMKDAAIETKRATHTNVNLGIILLLGPIVAADEANHRSLHCPADWCNEIAKVIRTFDAADGQNIYAAIGAASAGGLGEVDSMDVRHDHESIDIVSAMDSAKQRDRIARQYATGFRDLIENVVPVVADQIRKSGDVISGIARAHVRILSEAPDTLIARKCGPTVAQEVQRSAATVDVDNAEDMLALDTYLRSDDHRLNPGTTADLIAASMYLLLRTDAGTF